MTVAVRLDDLDLGAVRLFLTVVELGSVSKAAARHGMAQPSATARLQKLERQLGLALLERGPTGSTPTGVGLEIAPLARALSAAAADLADEAGRVREAGTVRLRVAATETIADGRLPEWMAAVDLRDVVLDLVIEPTAMVARLVRTGEAELGFLDGPSPPLGLQSEVVGHETLVVVVGRDHRWSGRQVLRPAELVAGDLILRRRGSGTLDVIEAALGRHGLDAGRTRLTVTSTAAARLAAINGVGAAILPRSRIHGDVEAGRLRIVPLDGMELVQPVRMAWRGARPAGSPARQLVAGVRRIRS